MYIFYVIHTLTMMLLIYILQAFSPNLKYVASVGFQHDMIVNIWNWKVCICCSSIFTLEQFVFELVQNSLNWYNFNCTGAKTVKIV